MLKSQENNPFISNQYLMLCSSSENTVLKVILVNISHKLNHDFLNINHMIFSPTYDNNESHVYFHSIHYL